jgi:predicted nucleic-acid-binding Zn-ribbon protein
MITRRDAALRLDIPLEMARRHGIPSRLSEAELAEMESQPPAWLVQSRSNRTSSKPVWVQLTCHICGFTEAVRPKKWWPEFTWLTCSHHGYDELPEPASGLVRTEYDGIGSRFIGVVDQAGR